MNILEIPKSELLEILEEVLQKFEDGRQYSPFICNNITWADRRYTCLSSQLYELAKIYSVTHLIDLTEAEIDIFDEAPNISKIFWAPSNIRARKNFLETLISRIKEDVK